MPESEFFSPFASGVGSLIHPDARRDAQKSAYHGAFIATRLLAGGAALVAFPLYLAVVGKPDLLSAVAFIWLMAPIALALFVSRTGRLGTGQVLSAASLAGLVTTLATATGGPASAFLPWLVAVPAEAALGASRRVFAAAMAAAFAAVAAIAGSAFLGPLPAAIDTPLPAWTLLVAGVLPALCYIAALVRQAGALRRRLTASGTDADPAHAALLAHAPDALTRHRRNGNLTWANAAAESVLGAPADELCGDGLFRRIHVADRPAYLKAFDDAAAGRERSLEFRLRCDGERGSDFAWIEMRCRWLPAAEGEAPDVVAVMRDVTPRKAEEESLNDAFEEAERASLAKSRFLATMSHELRTPLNAIIGFSEILSQEMFGKLEQERHREYAELIRTSGIHLLDLINDILDMSKIEAGHFEIVREPFDLRALVDSCARMLDPQIKAGGLRLETDLPVNLPELVADRRACKQMLINLMHNAMKFSEPGGRVVVGAYVERDVVTIYVADEGIGIAPADLKRIGQPFVQVHSSYDRNYEGTGLGLSVVKGLAALHGGSLEIESEPGVGTRALIRLPMTQDAPTDRKEAPTGAPQRLSA